MISLSYYLFRMSRGKEYSGGDGKPLPWWFFGTLLFVGVMLIISGIYSFF
jgi:uncharacterized membrane-anchored protein